MTLNAKRAFSAIVFICSIAVLSIAAWLTPDPSGVGTHTQLGLKPCILMSMLDLPCPMCGMTTTFSLMANGRPIEAFLNQPFGVFLFLLTVFFAVVAGMEIVFPKKRWIAIARWPGFHKGRFVLAFSVGFFGSWLYKIAIVKEMLSGIP